MKLQLDFHERPIYSPAYLDLHRKFDVPLQNLTPEQTRFFHYTFRNEINVFFRTCDLTGEKIMSQFSADAPFKIYRHDLWWGDNFPIATAAYTTQEDFFKQFRRLQLQVPRMSIASDTTVENCPFVNCVNRSKDCYMIFASGNSRDCLYSINLERSRDTMDASIAHECEYCYEITSCRGCYDTNYCANCIGCRTGYFLYDCQGCTDCFMCVGLKNKSHCILNKQYTPEDYKIALKKYLPLTHEIIDLCYDQLAQTMKKYIHKYANITGSENCTGNDIANCQNCQDQYICEESQDCYSGSSLRKCKDCLDFNLRGDPGELCYNSMSCGYNVYFLRMCFDCWNNCRFLTYCDSCTSCEECFGCIGLKNKSYCILNKQYTKEDYFQLKEKIIQDMNQSGEWGKFFPSYCSPYPLNNTMAHEYFYTDEALAEKLGYRRMDKSHEFSYDENKVYNGSLDTQILEANQVLGKVFICKKTKKPYNIQRKEFELLKAKHLPLPNTHRRKRMEDRDEKFIFPRILHKRTTVDTNKELLSPVPLLYRIREKDI